MIKAYLALDLGAGSGRAIAGYLQNNQIVLDEIHRFPNRQVLLGDTLYWDFPALFAEIKQGIGLAVKKGYQLQGIAVDTWGVDFGLLDKKGHLLSNPVCYRDNRTEHILEAVFRKIAKEKLYAVTGNQLMSINTAFQLFSMVQSGDPLLSISEKLLFMPDLINYFLTGFAGNEYTIASTSQLLNAQTKAWEPTVFDSLDIPQKMVSEIVLPGTIIGKLKPEIAMETGAGPVDVIAVGSHDTASAIAAIPSAKGGRAYLSSGTWSLLGIESNQAIMTAEAMNAHFSNEGGVGGKIRFLRNITGLWILQRLIAEEENRTGRKMSYEKIVAEAALTEPNGGIIDPDDELFANPPSMNKAIHEYCIRHQVPVPRSLAASVRMVLDSLALKYAQAMTSLKHISGQSVECLYVVGGGSQNNLLNQLSANALKMEVRTGSVESTALGNILVQAIAKQEIASLEEGRALIQQSFESKIYNPQE